MNRRAGKKSKKAKLDETATLDFAAFRRAIHSDRDLTAGISQNRPRVAPQNLGAVAVSMMRNSIYRSIIAPDPFPKSYSDMKSKPYLRALPLQYEIVWNASVIQHFSEQISACLDEQKKFSDAFMLGEFVAAQAVLDEIERKYGLSIWSMNARLSLNHAQADAARAIQELHKILSMPNVSPLVACLAYYFKYTLEQNVTLAAIRRDFGDGHASNDYLLYHVSPLDLNTVRQLGNCLWYEQNSAIIDRYITLLEMMQLLCARRQHTEHLKLAIAFLKDISDPRIKTLAYAMGVPNFAPNVHPGFLEACDLYTLGEYQRAEDWLTAFQAKSADGAWTYELSARTDTALAREQHRQSPISKVISEINSFLYLKKDLADIHASLHTLAFETRKTSAAKCIAAILDRFASLPISRRFTPAQVAFALSGPISQPLNYSIIQSEFPERLKEWDSDSAAANSVAHSLGMFAIAAGQLTPDFITQSQIPKKRQQLYLAYHYYNRGDYSEATRRFDAYSSDTSFQTDPRTATFQYALFRQQNLIAPALAAFVDAFFLNQRSHTLYDMPEICLWAIEEGAIDSCALDRTILLHIRSTYYGSDHTGDLSDALEDTLDYHSVRRPSELLGQSIDRQRLIYFFRYVATIDRLEDTTRLDSLDDIELERIRLLQWLVQNDLANRSAYTQEISTITKDQEVARLSAEFERSKIYVHEDGIRRTFDGEIRPIFMRYRQLIADPRLDAELAQIESRIREILKNRETEFSLLIPSSERDSIYSSMVRRSYEIFLTDPIHGFKTYLSTRILHGVLEGELRSSFLNAGLMFSYDAKAKDDEILQRWQETISTSREDVRRDIIESVGRFSDKIIELINSLKDQRIRVWSKETPQGLFKLNISMSAFVRLKSSITATSTYEEFFERLLAQFWESMEYCLTAVKEEITGHFRKQVGSAFDSLENALVSVRGNRPSEILDAIATCRAAFSRDIERVSAWFVRAGVMSRERFFMDTAVRVAARITNNCYPAYPLSVIFKGDDRSLQISGELLNPLVDLLTNCFQNAAEHSGIRQRAPKTSIDVSRRQDGALSVNVVTELSESLDLVSLQKEIIALTQDDEISDPNAVAKEGKTGIRKMKRILKHDFRSNESLSVEVDDKAHEVHVAFAIPGFYVNEHSSH